MMGYGHAAMGAAGFLALTSSSSLALGIAPQPLPVVAAGALLTAGAALLPDLDHHDGTIARSVPAVRILGVTLVPSPTQAMAARIERASGGHRHLTHSLVGIGAATAAAAGLTLLHLPADRPRSRCRRRRRPGSGPPDRLRRQGSAHDQDGR